MRRDLTLPELNASEQFINLTQYAKENLSLAVIEVSDLDEVMLYLTGAQTKSQKKSL